MSFNIEFVAQREDARQIVGQEHLPTNVRDFLLQALTAFKPESLVSIKAVGHLYDSAGSYQQSSATIIVSELALRKPKPPA